MIFDFWVDFLGTMQNIFRTVRWQDILDILIVAYLIYQAIKLVRETRAVQLLKGIAILLLANIIAKNTELRTMTFLTDNVFQVGLFALIVVFQPELRRALEQVGRSRIGQFTMFSQGNGEQDGYGGWKRFIDALIEEAPELCRNRIGALIVIEQNTKLGEIINTGTIIDSGPSAQLIGNIFFPNSPLHDGAMIVRDGRLHAAGCFLPLSENTEISRELGTRHRAALGVSEMSDAIVVVVSEETGLLTVCQNGKLTRGVSLDYLKTLMMNALTPDRSNSDGSEKRVERISERIKRKKQ